MRCSMKLARKVLNQATFGNSVCVLATSWVRFANLFDNGFRAQ